MMPPMSRLVVILLPLVGLAGLWGWSDYQSRQGVEWRVPIEGYDPRDLLRGHYVEFTYDWPGLENLESVPDQLCIYGSAPEIDFVEPILVEGEDCRNLVVADQGSVYAGDSLIRGRLYLEQDRALEMEELLRDPDLQGSVLVRVTEAGTITPVDISFVEREDSDEPEI